MATTSNYPLRWNLRALGPVPGETAFQERIDQLEATLKQLQENSNEISDLDNLAARVEAWEAATRTFEDLTSIVLCHVSEDTTNAVSQKFETVLTSLRPLLETVSSQMERALGAFGTGDFEELLQDSRLQARAFALRESRESLRFRFPDEWEALVSNLDVHGIHAWGQLYDRLSGKLRVSVMREGELVQKSVGQIDFTGSDRCERRENFHATEVAWNSIAEPCAEALNHICGTRLAKYEKLGLADHLELPLHKNRTQRETLTAMWQAVSDRKEKLGHYLKLKARLLGIEKLTWYDQFAPLPVPMGHAQPTIDYDEACERIIGAFSKFNPAKAEFAEQALTQGWIEAEDRAGKRQGGFCTGIAEQGVSRIFMTFTGRADSVSTLAHELGHAYHSWVLKDEPYFHQGYPMTLAETASTFAEGVLAEQELEETISDFDRLALLDKMLQDSMAFMMNLHARFLFEDAFHREFPRSGYSVDEFSQRMVTAQKEAYRDLLAEDGWNPTFWISKLHFYISTYPFYNFPYTFGYLLSLGILRRGKAEEPAEFAGKYKDFLVNTGRMHVEDVVRESFGDDVTTVDFWNRCIDVVDERVDEFEKLAMSWIAS